jgi:hypothetical protein
VRSRPEWCSRISFSLYSRGLETQRGPKSSLTIRDEAFYHSVHTKAYRSFEMPMIRLGVLPPTSFSRIDKVESMSAKP